MTHSKPEDAFTDSLSFIKKLWAGVNVPGMSMPDTSSMMPTMPSMGAPIMSLEELDKRIQELKSVETWLNLNTSMLRNTIHALEIQRATISTLHSLSSTMAQTMQNAESATSVGDKVGNPEAKKMDDASKMAPLVSQSAMWWNAVQEQFKHALGTALESTAAAKTPDKVVTKRKAKAATTNKQTTARRATSSKPRKAG